MTPSCINNGGVESLILLPETPFPGREILCAGPVLERLGRWRARAGEVFTVCDPQGRFFRGRLTFLNPSEAGLMVFAPFPFSPESPLRLDLYQALPQRERFELILEKATELGVSRIVPYVSAHSITLEERDARQRKSHRWPELLLRAAKQCRRAMIPELFPVLGWTEALREAARSGCLLICSEKESGHRLRERIEAAGKPRHVSLLVGPEGGFDAEEMALAQKEGGLPVSLGGRILRTETAAVLAAALVQHLLGDLG
ncbi:MAG: 16S rRNA (uracil(1498)-N(3))-methyltransferase [Deltaproteobacteria bacterium]|nr:16S rRNA (uracil(1498)-N(3))-methyltransferase [Deltaproteobacteria bacterium]